MRTRREREALHTVIRRRRNNRNKGRSKKRVHKSQMKNQIPPSSLNASKALVIKRCVHISTNFHS